MKVWIANPFDNLPMEGNRPQRYWLMARAFARAGHRVAYWTSDFSHAKKRKRVFTADNREPEIDVRMVPTIPYPRNICLRRIASHVAFAREWRRMASASGETPDAVIASMPPISSCLAAMEFAGNAGAKFIADIMDAWPETFYRVAPRWIFAPLRAKVRRIYRGADAVSAVAARYLDLAKSYGAASPMHCCNHGIEMKGGKDAGGKRRGGALRIVYAGTMGASYDLETVIDAVLAVDGISLDLAGSGPKEARLRKRAAGSERIRFHGYLGGDALRALLESCDAGIVPMFPESCVGVPYKLADYAAAGLRVIECLGGETGEIVSRHNAGLHYEAGNVESLKRCLMEMSGGCGEFDASGFADEFDATRIMDGYVKWTEGLVA